MNSTLLAVCGTTPQILTETLYALHCEGALPVRVVVLTTQAGKQACGDVLFGSRGMLSRFFAEYGISSAACRFSEKDIFTASVGDAPLEDIADRAGAAAFQELCMRQACLLTRDGQGRVDFSLAGGRKTMGASLALAAQCYGRAADRLFHVLVTPAFESRPDFFYPTREDCLLACRSGLPPLNARDARVTLAPLPFLRLRPHLPAALLRQPQPPEQLFSHFAPSPPSPLVLDFATRRVCVRDASCVLPPVEFCLLAAFALRKCNAACTGACATCGHACFVDAAEFLADNAALVRLYAAVKVTSAARSSTGILNLSLENFMTYKAKLHRRLWQVMGGAAEEAGIMSIGVRPHVRYGLRAEKKAIRVQNVPSW